MNEAIELNVKRLVLAMDSLIDLCKSSNIPEEQIKKLKDLRHEAAMMFTDLPTKMPVQSVIYGPNWPFPQYRRHKNL